ncbi:hypothetical protein UT300012_32930 [Paraclostridium bifermentans]
MKTGIKDKNGIEIYVGDKVRKVNRVDNTTTWTVTFGRFKAIINHTIMSIYTFILIDKDGHEEIMETEIYWQYTKEDVTEYEIIK